MICYPEGLTKLFIFYFNIRGKLYIIRGDKLLLSNSILVGFLSEPKDLLNRWTNVIFFSENLSITFRQVEAPSSLDLKG